ncbi:hypothetical protein Tco_0583364 [Tanacetum coccineum]
MSNNEQTPVSQPTSVVRNTLGKEQVPQDSTRPISDEALREYCDKNYHQILPIIAEKVHQEKVQQEKLKAVKARLNFEETSRHSESGRPSRRRSLKERLGQRHVLSRSGSSEPRRDRSRSPKGKDPERRTSGSHVTVAARIQKALIKALDLKKQKLPLGNTTTKESTPRKFMHGITNPELIKRLHDNIPTSMDEMMRVTTVFLRGEDRYSLLTKTPKEIFALDKGKLKAPPPLTTLVEKRNQAKFCEFHGEVGHNTDECMHMRKQIEEMLKAGKLSHLIKEIKQNNGKEQPKIGKKGETSGKDKALAILMVIP